MDEIGFFVKFLIFGSLLTEHRCGEFARLYLAKENQGIDRRHGRPETFGIAV